MHVGKIFNFMIGATSDLVQEVETIRQAFYKWNDLNSEGTNSIIHPLHWSTSVYPAFGDYAQDVINKQIVSQSDALICILKNRIGSPTPSFESGCIEEIELHKEADKPVMVFFINEPSAILHNSTQYDQLIDFKKKFGTSAIYIETTYKDLLHNVFEKLTLLMHQVMSKYTLEEIINPQRPTTEEIFGAISERLKVLSLKYPSNLKSDTDSLMSIENKCSELEAQYCPTLSENIISSFSSFAYSIGLSPADFHYAIFDDQEFFIYKQNDDFIIQVMRYSLGRYPNISLNRRDVSVDFFFDKSIEKKAHLYLKCESVQKITELLQFWLLSIRDYEESIK